VLTLGFWITQPWDVFLVTSGVLVGLAPVFFGIRAIRRACRPAKAAEFPPDRVGSFFE
jgi:hypothetical protein